MRRREVLAGLALATSAPRAGLAQEAPRLRRLGILIGGRGGADTEGQARLTVLRRGLAEHGWVEGRTLQIELRFAAGDPERIQASAAELVALQPEVIVANSTPAVAAVARLTKTIPIVFAQIVDPVGLGYVATLARPGGNLTGFTFVDLDLVRKWPEMLSEVVPTLTRAALLFNPATTPFYAEFVRSVETSPGAVPLVSAPVPRLEDLDAVIGGLARVSGTGLVIPPNPLLGANRALVAELALKRRLPSVSVYQGYARDGGLMAYGPDSLDIYRRSTAYVDRILRGAQAAELPVQAPTKYELALNLKTAHALGLTIPPSLLARADEVIE